ncbi:hypothetical protein TREMEDRAFT_25891, partial [Tremella mesenterica DSM 1558]|uniref:uncharacterized protein n=1 Tax=Tremella mesenterica (strain ATCC 24925 / CBS 8224 / DSM 1558 / NBRC 9311 / NRRL Y-6157 / RJB 2259-6 / UBC 559-6) TaxID=578456 RepID=UPI0003F4990E
QATGSIPLSRYIQFCLSHPVHGYYSKGDIFGRKGDFVTSPEISQVFGELVGIWFMTRWLAAGQPSVRLLELGPGRGTLMDDILRTLYTFPGMASAIRQVHLVENSVNMQQLQADKLGQVLHARGISLSWSDKIDDVPMSELFTFVVAHEFFDAIPINLFEKTNEGFREVLVDLNPKYETLSSSTPSTSFPKVVTSTKSPFHMTLSREPTPLSTVLPATSPRFASIPSGGRLEIAGESWRIMRRLGEIISSEEGKASTSKRRGRGGGAGLIIDYGGEKYYGASFRAFQKHKLVDVFENPGEADLTANVDFEYLKESLDGLDVKSLGTISQSDFLLKLGLQPRLEKLSQNAETPERKETIRKSAQRLIDPLGMGSQYRILGLVDGSQSDSEIYPFPSLQ